MYDLTFDRESINESCFLCGNSNIIWFCKDKKRDYLKCLCCNLIFIPEKQRLSRNEEVKRYNLHQNNMNNDGYLNFLYKLIKPLSSIVASKSCGLDFGSGPNPVLSAILSTKYEYLMTNYDVFYNPEDSAFNHKYDFITAIEVLEHLYYPGKELTRLWNCLKTGGVFAVMTKVLDEKDSFENWFYKNDPTHVVFFSKSTFIWLKNKLHAEIKFECNDVIIFKKI